MQHEPNPTEPRGVTLVNISKRSESNLGVRCLAKYKCYVYINIYKYIFMFLSQTKKTLLDSHGAEMKKKRRHRHS